MFVEKKKAPPPKVIKELLPDERLYYSKVFEEFLKKTTFANKGNLVSVSYIEDMMNSTQFKLFDDPEAVNENERKLDPEGTKFFSLSTWLIHMKMKTNYIEEDLIRAFKVFDTDLADCVNKEELRVAFMNLIGKPVVDESKLDGMFDEALPQMDENGNIDYEALVKVMLAEPDPLLLPQEYPQSLGYPSKGSESRCPKCTLRPPCTHFQSL